MSSIYLGQLDMNLKTRVQFTWEKIETLDNIFQYSNEWKYFSLFCERYWLKRSLITVVLIIRLALPLFCQINPIQITIIISESKKFPNDTFKQWWNVSKVTHLDVKHEYLRSRAYICLSFSSPFPLTVSQGWPLLR